MTFAWFRNSLILSVTPLALVVTLSGCGGEGPNVDEAIIVSAPDATTATKSAPDATTPAAPSAGATPAATTPAASTAAVTAEGWGTLKGRVSLKGTDPKFPALGLGENPSPVCTTQPIPNEKLVVGADNGIKYAIVYIPKPTKVNEDAKKAAQTATVVFDQDKCVFKPHVLAAMTGAKIKIRSSDAVGHNVDSKVENNSMNSAIGSGQEIDVPLTSAARRPGLVICDIHSWMTAYWLILDNPYFAVTDEKGNYEIKNVPAGTQKVVVWQEGVTFVTPTSGQDIVVAANGETTQDFSVDAAKVKK